MIANNGRRVQIEGAVSPGPAAIVEKPDGSIMISFFMDGRRGKPTPGQVLMIEGAAYEVTGAEDSGHVRSVVVVNARKADAQPAA